jgi:hypothetical protein
MRTIILIAALIIRDGLTDRVLSQGALNGLMTIFAIAFLVDIFESHKK